MRALRTLLIVVVVLAGLFVVADRVVVHFAEDQAAQEIRTSQHLSSDPDVDIRGFPFLTQAASGELDDVRVRMTDYPATTGTATTGTAAGDTVVVHRIDARLEGVSYSSDFSSATARQVTGTATVTYAELLRTAQAQTTAVAPGVTARVVGLSDGGDGRIRSTVEVTFLGRKLPRVPVVGSVTVTGGNTVHVHADSLPSLGIDLSGTGLRSVTDFSQRIEGLPGGLRLESVRAGNDGVDIAVRGSDVRFTG